MHCVCGQLCLCASKIKHNETCLCGMPSMADVAPPSRVVCVCCRNPPAAGAAPAVTALCHPYPLLSPPLPPPAWSLPPTHHPTGTVGGTTATPMLNPPEAAIVALGRVQALPRYDPHTSELVKRHIMAVSWGGDHRVVDGAAIAEFSNFWKHLLQQPSRLLMHMR